MLQLQVRLHSGQYEKQTEAESKSNKKKNPEGTSLLSGFYLNVLTIRLGIMVHSPAASRQLPSSSLQVTLFLESVLLT